MTIGNAQNEMEGTNQEQPKLENKKHKALQMRQRKKTLTGVIQRYRPARTQHRKTVDGFHRGAASAHERCIPKPHERIPTGDDELHPRTRTTSVRPQTPRRHDRIPTGDPHPRLPTPPRHSSTREKNNHRPRR